MTVKITKKKEHKTRARGIAKGLHELDFRGDLSFLRQIVVITGDRYTGWFTLELFLIYTESCIQHFHLLNAELPPTAPFPRHLLRLFISIIPCSSSIFKYLKLSKNYMVPDDLASSDPQDRSLIHALVKLFSALRCASFLSSLLPALWDQELLSPSLPQPWEVKRKKPAFIMKWLLTVNAELRRKQKTIFWQSYSRTDY